MSSTRTLHFTLGPVQGFIAQARRTRDTAAGSFILSYLVGCAMNEVLKGGGSIEFPAVHDGARTPTDPLLRAIADVDAQVAVKDGPQSGTLPNRFKARIPEDFDPKRCAVAVRRAWRRIADAVFGKYLKPVLDKGRGTREIWDRQVEGFWEIAWVIGDSDDLLDRRKNWRSHVPTDEPGDKCTIMGNLQELSGYVRAKERRAQDEFWKAVQANAQLGDIREGERLCAVSFIKRFFCRVAEEAIGWSIEPSYPSTVYMSAIHWMERAMREKPELARSFAVEARAVEQIFPREWRRDQETGIPCIDKEAGGDSGLKEFAGLSADLFFAENYDNDRLWRDGSDGARQRLRKVLDKFQIEPTPFYAVLVMDGDNMGALLRGAQEPAAVSRALLRFGGKVGDIVKSRNGIIVYSGGDDVLAFMPLEDALPAAAELRQAYLKAFDLELRAELPELRKRATISAAIVYAHHKTPLQRVLGAAHDMLDRVAKDRTGRDALAIKVWKGAGAVVEWAAPWDVVLDTGGGRDYDSNIFDELVSDLTAGAGGDKKLTTSFFYRVRERFAAFGYEWDDGLRHDSRKMSPVNAWETGAEDHQSFQTLDPIKLLTAEYLKSREIRASREEAERVMEKLLKVCQRTWRDSSGEIHRDSGRLDVNGALLVKFLAAKGVGE